jgi:hypothetical protein
MQHAIKIDDGLSVIVAFASIPVKRLTPQGLFETEATQAMIFAAAGLKPLGAGMALRSNEDAPSEFTGMQKALESALHSTFPFDRDARSKVFTHFNEVMQDLKNDAGTGAYLVNEETGQLQSILGTMQSDPVGAARTLKATLGIEGALRAAQHALKTTRSLSAAPHEF